MMLFTRIHSGTLIGGIDCDSDLRQAAMPGQHSFFLVDAFCQHRFGGNQAAIILAQSEINDEEKQKLGAEFNLSETAFPEPRNGDFKTASHFGLRWFTPTVEVPLCGHATLATAHALFYEVGNINSKIRFETKSGDLMVSRGTNGGVDMDFPQYRLVSIGWPEADNKYAEIFEEHASPDYLMNVIRCLVPEEMNIEGVVYAPQAKKLLVVVDPDTTKFELGNLFSEYKKMVDLHPEGTWIRGIAVTLAPRHPAKQGFINSKGEPYDYVCRYFAPWAGIDEDPATGSAQCALGPFWATILGKNELKAFQSYPNRGAEFTLTFPSSERILIQGQAVTVVSGSVHI